MTQNMCLRKNIRACIYIFAVPYLFVEFAELQ